MVIDTTVFVTIVGVVCGACGLPFGLSREFYDKKRKSQKTFYCPRGCTVSYHGKTEEEKKIARLERKLSSAESSAKYEENRAARYQRKNSALKGHLTRKKRRAANGVCPCCKRTFQQLARHMKTKHPEYGKVNG